MTEQTRPQDSSEADASPKAPRQLTRTLGLFGAVVTGLGSIVGTGVFVSIAVGAGVVGPAVVVAIALAAIVAVCNGLSSAQLAADHPVSGGTYAYGYRYLSPRLGFTAGWLYLCAKSASAATAALGFAGYALGMAGAEDAARWSVPLALGAVAVMVAVTVGGARRSSWVNALIVSATFGTLSYFVLGGVMELDASRFTPLIQPAEGRSGVGALLEASALMFVAYTGYGRIATMGEEVRDPARTIPRAVIVTLAASMTLYLGVAVAAVGAAGAEAFAAAAEGVAAPLERLAQGFDLPAAGPVLAFGAVFAMLGVLLNLLLGLSRVMLGMARQGDMPRGLARLNAAATTPYLAVLVVGAIVAGLVCLGDVKTTWSFSAFTVLCYYALTNLAALRLAPEARMFPRAFSVLGLASCLFLAFWIEPVFWMFGLGLIGLGQVVFTFAERQRAASSDA